MAHIHDVIESVSAILQPVYLVGGSVRDALMGRESADFDFATPLEPDRIEQAIRTAGRRPYLMGKRFGTIAFKLDGMTVEVTSFRSERYSEGSRQPNVEFFADLDEDLSRRDFTINAMAMLGEELVDPFGGEADLRAGLVRAVGDPAERFAEDPLRMLRMARFASQLDFQVDPLTALAAASLASGILSVARERWMIELDHLLLGPGVEPALHLLSETGLIRFLLPEIGLQVGMRTESRPGSGSLFDCTVEAVGSAPPEICARWAALFRDAAVPYLPLNPGSDNNDLDRTLLAREIVERTALYLKWSNQRRETVERLMLEL